MPECEICLVRAFASDEAKDALILHQARQLDRLSHLAHGIPYIGPDPEDLVWDDDEHEPEPAPPPPPDALHVVETLMGDEAIFRRPPRVAAPRLIEGLAAAGLYLTNGET